MLLAFNKPYGVVTQFSETETKHPTLAGFGFPKDVYPLGRLDSDSEGLLLLSDESWMNARLLQPSRQHTREYWSQVEGIPTGEELIRLGRGVTIQGHRTLPCRVWQLAPQPEIPPRNPPIRYRAAIPTCWIALELVEGKNRQVRRMTAAIGHPTLRLMRTRIGGLELGSLPVGQWRELSVDETTMVFGSGKK